MSKSISLDYDPLPKQKILHETAVRQIFYGGSAGGAKSHGLRMHGIIRCLQNPGLQTYLFRRTLPELDDNHMIHLRRLPKELGQFNETRHEFNFANKSTMHCGYAEKTNDIKRYQGAEIHLLLVDEAALMDPFQLNFLRTRNRVGSFKAFQPNLIPQCVMASNPGGPAHAMLKRIFIDKSQPMTAFYDETMRNPKNPESKGWLSVYIPSRMADNPHLDTDYAGQFNALPPEMARAFIEGDWDAVVGAAYDSLNRDRHCLRPFAPPRHWTHFMALDWGTRAPFSVGWYAVSEGAELKGKDGWPDRWLPEGSIIRYAEWYGWNGREDEGCGLDSPAVARGILERERERNDPPMDRRIADNQMWASSDGPSSAERFALENCPLTQCKKDKKANYAEFRARLAGNPRLLENGKTEQHPMFFVTANCEHFWRTVPGLTIDQTDPDKGAGAGQEDHVKDEVEYALRSRPFVHTKETRWEQEYSVERRKFEKADFY